MTATVQNHHSLLILLVCGLQSWRSLLAESVENLLQQVPGLDNERMVMALTFSLVKAVCERVPLSLRRLYQVLIQYTPFTRPR